VDVPDLISYLAEYDLTLVDLAPEQLSMFVAARNLAHRVRGLEVDVGSQHREDGDALAERQTDRVLDLTAYDSQSLESHLPADEMEVDRIRGVEDLSRIFPLQWMWESAWPELFWIKLAQRELLMPEWQRPAEKPRDASEPSSQRELADEPCAAQAARQHAYVLLDTSSTMQDRDRRGTVARGLALEFLRRGHQQRIQLNVRPFAAEVGPLSSGAGPDAYHAIVRRIVELPNSGQTRIQTALEQAVDDIRSQGPCRGASILLITDGISRLTANPLAGETLHTFILGDLFEDKEKTGTISTLKAWSHTFHRVWGNQFSEILAPAWRDCQTAGRLLEAALETRANDPAAFEPGKLDRLLRNVQLLVKEYRRSLGKETPVEPEVVSLEKQLTRVEVMLRVARTQSPEPPVSHSVPGKQPGGSEGLRRTWRLSFFGGWGTGQRRTRGRGFAFREFLKRLATLLGARRLIAAFSAIRRWIRAAWPRKTRR